MDAYALAEWWMAERALCGNGHRPAVEAFPLQGCDLETRPSAAPRRTLAAKYPGTTVYGTLVAELVRSDHLGLLASRCGYCNEMVVKNTLCRCYTSGPTSNVDDWTSPREFEKGERGDRIRKRTSNDSL